MIQKAFNQQREISAATEDKRMKSIHENEKDYIISVLKKCNGRVGERGAPLKY